MTTTEKTTTMFEGIADCPAFGTNGDEIKCPFAQITRDVSKCPAFKDGCPFKKTRNVKELYELLETMPHTKEEIGTAETELIEMLRKVHTTSESLKTNLGSCPVFSEKCPFKSSCDGASGLSEGLEKRNWSLALTEEGEEEYVLEEEAEPEAPFSKMLKKGTQVAHQTAEKVHFVKAFIKGDIREDLYKQLIADLFHIYTVLERRLREEKDHRLLAPLFFPTELERVPSLEQDMEYWFGAEWRSAEEMTPTPCTKEYVERLEQCDAAGLLAHAYTRYMGDLSGGRTLMRRAKKALELESDNGLTFYVFKDIPKARAFKQEYRAALDGLSMDAETGDAVIAESNVAFLLNMRIFGELDVMAGDSDDLEPLSVAVQTLVTASRKKAEGEPAECPFASIGRMFGLANPHAEEEKVETADKKKREKTSAVPAAVVYADEGGCPVPRVAAHLLQHWKLFLPLFVVIMAIYLAQQQLQLA